MFALLCFVICLILRRDMAWEIEVSVLLSRLSLQIKTTLSMKMLISVTRLARRLMEDRVRCRARTLTIKLPNFLCRRNGWCRKAASTSSHPLFQRLRKRSHWQHRNLNSECKERLARLSFRLWTYCVILGQSMRIVNF